MNLKKNVSSESAQLSTAALSLRDILSVVCFFVLLTAVTLISVSRLTLAAVALSLILIVRKFTLQRLADRMSLALVGLVALTVMYGAGLLISTHDAEAMPPFFKFLCAISMALIPLCRFEKKHVRACLWGIMGFNVFHALISIEGATCNILYSHMTEWLTAVGLDMKSFSPGSFSSRLSGLYNSSNVTAALHAISLLIGLYLIRTALTRKEQFVAYVLTGINAVAFVACVSRGAMLCFGISGIVYLVLLKKEERVEEFFRIAIFVIVTFACQIACALPSITFTFVPLVITVLCGVIVWAIDQSVSAVLVKIFSGKKKLIISSIAVLSVACVIFLICAMTITRPYTFTGEEQLYRAVNLKPGSYTVSGDWDGEPQLMVVVLDPVSVYLDGSLSYLGALEGAEFTIPDNALGVRLSITGEAGTEIRDITFSNGVSVKLDYPFLPHSIVERMQGSITTDSSFVLRIQYIVDAFKIFAMSPLWGNGLGSSDALYTAVQQVYYMSVYVHNHLLQYMADMGLLGLISYLALAGGVLLLLLRRYRKNTDDPFAAMMIAVWTMMNVHSLIEFNFSIRCFLVIALLLYVLVMMECEGETAHAAVRKKTLKNGAVACFSVFLAFLVFFGSTIMAYRIVHIRSASFESTDYDEFMQTLEKYIALDMYDDTYHKTLYIHNAVGNPRYMGKAEKIAQAMVKTKDFTSCDAAAKSYYLELGRLPEMFQAIHQGIWQKAADRDSWVTEIYMLRNDALPRLSPSFMPDFVEGMVGLNDYFCSYNEDRLQPIVLDEAELAFLDACVEAFKSDMTNEEIKAFLMTFSEGEIPADAPEANE